MSDIANVGGGSNPVGTIISFMGITAPAGYLFCDGTVYNIANYPGLADHFETQFGAKEYFGGDGVDTFAVPDLQGEFLRCTGINSHTNQGDGASVGMHQDSTEIPIVALGANSQVFIPQGTSVDVQPQNQDTSFRKSGSGLGSTCTKSGTFNSSYNNIYTARPTNTSVLYCIKY